jgi:L-fucose mutarotase/ribose pyranase (RbsD/FucU family)
VTRALLPRLERAARTYLATCDFSLRDAIAALLLVLDDDAAVRRDVDARARVEQREATRVQRELRRAIDQGVRQVWGGGR